MEIQLVVVIGGDTAKLREIIKRWKGIAILETSPSSEEESKTKTERFNPQALDSESVEQSFEDSSYLDASEFKKSSSKLVQQCFFDNRFNNRFKRPTAGIYGPHSPALNESYYLYIYLKYN